MGNSCFWVPSNIRKNDETDETNLVYGGVLISPEVKINNEKTPARDLSIQTVFDEETHQEVGTDYIDQSRKFSKKVQRGNKNVSVSMNIRLQEAKRLEKEQKQEIKKQQTETRRQNKQRFFKEKSNKQPKTQTGGSGDSSGGSGDEKELKPETVEKPKGKPKKKAKKTYNNQQFFKKSRQKSGYSRFRKRAPRGFQIHHIIPKNKKMRDHELFDEKHADFDINSTRNLIYLPYDGRNHKKRTIHKGGHRKDFSDYMKKEMDDIVDQGKEENWSKQKYREVLLTFLSEERTELREGTLALNKNKREKSIFYKDRKKEEETFSLKK